MIEREKEGDFWLLPETKQLLLSVEQKTGRPVEVRRDAGIRLHARAVYVVTDPDRSRHLVLYDPIYEGFVDALIGHEVGHIFHFADASPSERIVPVITSTSRQVAHEDMAAFIHKLERRGLPSTDISEAFNVWTRAVVSQLADTPSDIRIERWLRDSSPRLRATQRAALLSLTNSHAEGMGKWVEEATPRKVWLASNAMSYALTKSISTLLAQPELLEQYKNTSVADLGEELLAIIDTEAKSLAGDRAVSKRWAERMGFTEWFAWRQLDEPDTRRAVME